MDLEARKRKRRCAICEHCVVVRVLKGDRLRTGDRCVHGLQESGGHPRDAQVLDAEFWTAGECPADKWRGLPDIDEAAEVEARRLSKAQQDVLRVGPLVDEMEAAGVSRERINDTLQRAVTSGVIEPEARGALHAGLEEDSSGDAARTED